MPDWSVLRASAQLRQPQAIKGFYTFLYHTGLVASSPADTLEMPRREKRLPVTSLSQTDIERLLATPDTSDPLGVRDRAILELFYSSALRRSELTGLEISDLNLTNRTLWIRQGKGRKDRVVPVGSRAILRIQRYLREVRPQLVLSQEEPGLFLTSYGTRFSPDVLTRRVRTLIRTAGIRHPGACHILRHTCATQMLEAGADIRLIQQLLGHADLRTTSVYTEVTIRHLRKVHQQTHPAERAAPKL